MKLERGRFLLSLKKGDHVVTSGGIHGTIKVLRDKYVELEIAPKVIIKVENPASSMAIQSSWMRRKPSRKALPK